MLRPAPDASSASWLGPRLLPRGVTPAGAGHAGVSLLDFGQSANLWWPQDLAWCVATEIDLMETLVGGSAAAIAAVLANRRLESWATTPTGRVDSAGDTRNPLP